MFDGSIYPGIRVFSPSLRLGHRAGAAADLIASALNQNLGGFSPQPGANQWRTRYPWLARASACPTAPAAGGGGRRHGGFRGSRARDRALARRPRRGRGAAHRWPSTPRASRTWCSAAPPTCSFGPRRGPLDNRGRSQRMRVEHSGGDRARPRGGISPAAGSAPPARRPRSHRPPRGARRSLRVPDIHSMSGRDRKGQLHRRDATSGSRHPCSALRAGPREKMLTASFAADASYIWLDEEVSSRHGVDYVRQAPTSAALRRASNLALARGSRSAAYGRRISHDAALARYLGELVTEHPDFELMTPVSSDLLLSLRRSGCAATRRTRSPQRAHHDVSQADGRFSSRCRAGRRSASGPASSTSAPKPSTSSACWSC